jgi:hypothetical protein
MSLKIERLKDQLQSITESVNDLNINVADPEA